MTNPEPRPFADPSATSSVDLSPHGRVRQAEILELLHRTAVARQNRRRFVRRGMTLAVAISAGALALRAFTGAPTPERIVHTPTPSSISPSISPATAPTPSPTNSPSPAVPPTVHHTASVTIVTNAVVAMADCNAAPPRGAGEPSRPTVCLLSDDQLLSVLADAGEDYGLIRTTDRVELIRNSN